MIELNMDVLQGKPNAVVHCKTESDARHLLDYLKEYYPNKVRNWTGEYTEWDMYKEDTVYYVYWGIPSNLMLYGDINRIDSNEIVIEFDDLIRMVVDLPIQSSGMAIESLFG
jgi:hypothetical protein